MSLVRSEKSSNPSTMKIGVISNMMMGVAGMEFLLKQNSLCCVTIPDFSTDANEAVKKLCTKHSIPLQILTKDSYSTQLENWIESNEPETVITTGCPYKIPANLLEDPERGFWNIHPGALPKYAGMDPIFWHVRNREKELLITVHKMTKTLDAGPILLEIPLKIPRDQTYGQIWNQVQQLGSHVFKQIMAALQKETPTLRNQQNIDEKTYTKKPGSEHMTINWVTMSAAKIRAVVDACNPNYGGAFSLFRDGFLKILRLTSSDKNYDAKPGTIVKVDESGLWVQTKDEQSLKIEIINMPGGYLTGADLSNLNIKVGEQFHSPS